MKKVNSFTHVHVHTHTSIYSLTYKHTYMADTGCYEHFQSKQTEKDGIQFQCAQIILRYPTEPNT